MWCLRATSIGLSGTSTGFGPGVSARSNHEGISDLASRSRHAGRTTPSSTRGLFGEGVRSHVGKHHRCGLAVEGPVRLAEGWESEVYSWLSDKDCSEIENTDDRGGYPNEDALRRAFAALGFEKTE